MKYIKRFLDTLNEGAYIDPNNLDQAVLNYTNFKPNHPLYNDEVLVTAIEKKGYASNVFFPKYYALAPFSWDHRNTKVIDHPGRFKYTMDLLKSGKIVGPNGENAKDAVKNFIGSVISSPNMPKPAKYKYVVSLGSTQGLVKIMSDSVSEITGATQIDLPKINYKHILDSIDIDRFKEEVNRNKDDDGKKDFIKRIKGEMLQELNIFDNDPIILKRIKKTEYETVDDLMADVMELDSKNALKWSTEIGKYIVRTSGVGSGGGSRKVKKNKYMTDLSDFVDAIKDCATSKNKMLILDDNINSGIDANSVFDAIDAVVQKMIEEEVIDSPTKVNRKAIKSEIKGEPITYTDEYKLNFIFLLLYNMLPPSSKKANVEIGFRYFLKDKGTDKYYIRLDTSKEVIKDFEKFIKQKPSDSTKKISIFQELRFSYKPHHQSTTPRKNSPELVVTIDEKGKMIGFKYDNLQYIDYAYSMGWVGDDPESQISSNYDVRLWRFNIYASVGTKIMNDDGSFTQIFKDWLTRLKENKIDLFMNGSAITPNSKNWWDSPKALEEYIEREENVQSVIRKKKGDQPKTEIPTGKTRVVNMKKINPSTGASYMETVWMTEEEFQEYINSLKNKK